MTPRDVAPLATALSAYSICTSLPDGEKVVRENEYAESPMARPRGRFGHGREGSGAAKDRAPMSTSWLTWRAPNTARCGRACFSLSSLFAQRSVYFKDYNDGWLVLNDGAPFFAKSPPPPDGEAPPFAPFPFAPPCPPATGVEMLLANCTACAAALRFLLVASLSTVFNTSVIFRSLRSASPVHTREGSNTQD